MARREIITGRKEREGEGKRREKKKDFVSGEAKVETQRPWIGKICGEIERDYLRGDETATLAGIRSAERLSSSLLRGREGRTKRERGGEKGRGARFVDERGIARTPLEERRKVAEMLFRRLRASFIAWEIALGR